MVRLTLKSDQQNVLRLDMFIFHSETSVEVRLGKKLTQKDRESIYCSKKNLLKRSKEIISKKNAWIKSYGKWSSLIVIEIDGIPQSDVDHIKSYIRNHTNERILLSTLPSNLKRKYTKEQYLPIRGQLETDGHGAVTSTDNTTGPKAIVFVKKPRTEPTTESQNTITSSKPYS